LPPASHLFPPAAMGPLLITDDCSSYFFAGAGVKGLDWKGTGLEGGFAGADTGADFTGACSSTEPEEPLEACMARVMDVIIKTAARPQVIFASRVTEPRGPKAAWLTPPKAAVISTFSPP